MKKKRGLKTCFAANILFIPVGRFTSYEYLCWQWKNFSVLLNNIYVVEPPSVLIFSLKKSEIIMEQMKCKFNIQVI